MYCLVMDGSSLLKTQPGSRCIRAVGLQRWLLTDGGGEGEAGGDRIPAVCPAVRKGAALALVADDLGTLCRNFLPCFVEVQLLGSSLFIYIFLINRNFEICLKMDIHHKKKKVWLVTLDFLSSIQPFLWI